jgi:hypothetical protein
MPQLSTDYVGIYATSQEKSLTKSFNHVYMKNYPLLSILYDDGRGSNFNKGFSVEGALKMLLPIAPLGNVQAAIGRAAGTYTIDGTSQSWTGSSIGQKDALSVQQGQGLNQAAYEITQYECAYWQSEEERKLALEGARGGYIEARTTQVLQAFKDKASTDLVSTSNAGARTALMGVPYALSTSNSPGGLSQSTLSNWASNVNASGGPFTLDLVDAQLHAVRAKGRNRVDFIFASYQSGNDVYGKMKAAIAPAQLLTVPENLAKYGFVDYVYSNVSCVLDNYLASGKMLGVSSKNWFLYGDTKPSQKEPLRVQGTGVVEYYYTWWVGLGTNDPGVQFQISAIV